jgi:DNA recombination protein RmuC
MFVPNEPAFMSALQADSPLWSEAYNKRVIISSPTNLFALLKIVDDLWKRDDQTKNTLEIARQGGAMYDKFVGFYETLEKVGRNIKNVKDSYDTAMSQLEGHGSLINRAESLHKLGIKASKKLPAGLVEMANDDEDL